MDPGGALRFEWLPTAKQLRRAEAVNAKIQGRSTPFGAKKRGGGGGGGGGGQLKL